MLTKLDRDKLIFYARISERIKKFIRKLDQKYWSEFEIDKGCKSNLRINICFIKLNNLRIPVYHI